MLFCPLNKGGDMQFKNVLFFLVLLAGCGGVGVDNPTTTSPTTSKLNLSVSNSAAASISVAQSTGKGINVSVAKAAAVTTGSIRCVSTDSSGTKTVNAGSLDSSGNASVSSIPANQETICYLLDASGNILATTSVSDTKAVGGVRDGFKMDANKTASAAVTYSSTTGSCTNDCSGSSCKAPASVETTDIDLSGTWSMKCNGIKRTDNDQADTSQTCSSDIDGQNVFLHRVQATDSDGVTRFGYGAWPSQAAFTACGSTEGVTSAPTGWSISTSGQIADFVWSAPFTSFSATSTSAEIATMIQNFAVANGVSQSFATYQTANCTGLAASQCAGQYYWAVVEAAVNANRAVACGPRIDTAWTQSDVTFSPEAALGGKTTPINRYDFMSTYKIGDQTYMKSFISNLFNAFNFTSNVSVECLSQDTLLISGTTPSTAPTTGTKMTTKFTNNKKTVSTAGTAAANTLCQQEGGSNSTFSTNGTYMEVALTKQ